MCQFVEAMEGLRSSSSLSVANEKFTEFNKYMHIDSEMDIKLKGVVELAGQKKKSLVLVCGNSGDGKSHLIANFISQNIISRDYFDIYIDATSSDKKGMRANEKLREKLDEFSDAKLDDGKEYRLIVAINLGVLNDFIKNYEQEYLTLKEYVEEQGLFDNVPAWKYALLDKNIFANNGHFGHVDFTSFHRCEIGAEGINDNFFSRLLDKILSDAENNIIHKAYIDTCSSCLHRDNCPVYWNYKELRENVTLRNYVISSLSKIIIKGNLSPSVREINDYFYEIIIGNTFDESCITSKSIDRLNHFIRNSIMWLLYENEEGLLKYIMREDVLGDQERRCDKQLLSLNLKPDFELWLKEDAISVSPIFDQIYKDILFCKNTNAKYYKENEQNIKQSVFKLYIRYGNVGKIQDQRYEDYLKYLFYYNIGLEAKCKDIIQLVEDCIYLWNGRLGDKSGSNIKNGVIISRASTKYNLFKKIEIKFAKDDLIESLESSLKLPYFSNTLRFGFKIKDSSEIIKLDIDYELYAFLLEIKNGFVPTNTDRKRYVKYDSFVRKIIAQSDSDMFVYTRNEAGKVYRISKGDFDNYRFEYEV